MKRVLSAVFFFLLPTSAIGAQALRHLKPSEIDKVKEAVEDEIYDYGYFADFSEIGDNVGTPQHWKARVHIFINPVYNVSDQHGETIYKLMPYGQIYRLFYIDAKGAVTLDGDPENRFPITQPSRQTVFMDDLDICRDEQKWLDAFLVVDTAPPLNVIEDAAQRQKVRTGFSDWEHEHPEKQ
jgi:hypothetical protein